MSIVLLRVGIDTGSGGIVGPIFADGTFEFIPIPDEHGNDNRTYGNSVGRHGFALVEYFPPRKRAAMAKQAMHVDPEFDTFTYGDPTTPKRGLARLVPGDLLVFYAGLAGWGCALPPALYLVGCFEVSLCGFAPSFADTLIRGQFGANFHVRNKQVFAAQRDRLLLIKGGPGSRLFTRATKLGKAVRRENGSKWQLISADMADIFGRFGGIGSIQRSNPRWVEPPFIEKARAFIARQI